MANRTRKRLTKTELKRDPIAENLMKGVDLIQNHMKEVIGGAIIIIVAILVIQMAVNTSKISNNEAMANFITAEMLFAQSEQYSAANQPEAAMQSLQACYSLSNEVYNRNTNKPWGRRAAILSAKVGIILGREGEVIMKMQDMLASNPPQYIANAARIHLSIALENRGGVEDFENAKTHLQIILDNSEHDSQIAAEAMAGLSRIAYTHCDYAESREWINKSLEITADTTAFVSYQFARLDYAQR